MPVSTSDYMDASASTAVLEKTLDVDLRAVVSGARLIAAADGAGRRGRAHSDPGLSSRCAAAALLRFFVACKAARALLFWVPGCLCARAPCRTVSRCQQIAAAATLHKS
jgi:hypothetical protein